MLEMTLRRRKKRYPLIGALVSLGAPLGLAALRAALAAAVPTPAWVVGEVARDPLSYAYSAISMMAVLIGLGRWLGSREDALEASSITDGLTGLFNRRHLTERLATELRRAARHGEALSVLLLDLDELKAINDRGGHASGDVALCRVAEALVRTCRSTDVAGRHGGDEFLVIAPSTAPAAAVDLGERIRATIHALAASSAARDGRLSVSIGVAGVEAGGRASPEELCALADRALYEAKARGKDRVVVAGVSAAATHPCASPGAE
jgi:diguanylate cyclase (GGDEF)-like protein